MRRAVAVCGFLVLLAGAFAVDTWVYENVSGPVSERAGLETWRFGRERIEGASALREGLLLFKRMGHAFFLLFVTITILVLSRWRGPQMLVLWLCIGFSTLVGQGLIRPAVSKLRADAPLELAQAQRIMEEKGSSAVLFYKGEPYNRGRAVFLRPFEGFRQPDHLSLPSGHATLAFAACTALSFFFPLGRRWFLALACGVALSRVLMGEHFLSDVIAGAAVGYVSARLVFAFPWIRFMSQPRAELLGSIPRG
jgi:membrane-associated phospholipid phosphatase